MKTAAAWLRDAPIRRKLSLVGLLTVGFALLAASLILTARDVVEWRARAVSDLTTYARMIATSATAAMLFDDEKAATETLSALTARPDIVHAAIMDAHGRQFASYKTPGHEHDDLPRLDAGEYRFDFRRLAVADVVRARDRPLGTVVLEMDLAPLYTGLARSAALIFLAATFAFILTAFLLAKLHRAIVAPIQDLTAAMQSVSALQDFSIHVPAERGDEVGQLAHTFNATLENIRTRDAQLERYRHHLEEEVASRTAELARTNAQLEHELGERQQAQRALHDSEEKFRAISTSAQDGVIMLNNDGRVSYWNPAAEKIFGFGGEEVLGFELHPLVAPERFRDAYLRGFARFRARGEGPIIGRTVELPARRKDGGEFPMELSLSSVRLAGTWNAIGIVRDVSARKAAEVEQRRLSEALRQLQEAVIIVDTALNFAYVNPAFTQLFGYDAEEVSGRSVAMLAPPHGTTTLRPDEVVQTTRSAGAFRGEVLRRAKDGRLIPVLLNVAPVRGDDGTIVNFVGTMSDLTELKQAEAEIRARVDELTNINDELGKAQSQLLQSEKMASIGLLSAGVAHEINNPVGFIKSNLQTLDRYLAEFEQVFDAYGRVEAETGAAAAFAGVERLKREIDFDYVRADVKSLLAESHDGIERVVKIIRDLKDFSRTDTQEAWREEDIHQGLDSTLNVVWNQLKYNCEVKKEYGELPPVECVLSQLNQVFMNLLVNAAQAIVGRGSISVRTGCSGDRVWIEIADTGTGIPPEHLQRIFDPFFTTKPVGKGTGLGLSVSYSIVQKHHGTIDVESEAGRGTTFRIWLPVRQPPPGDASMTSSAARS
jgi:PAS domain S-box-containing protein